MINRFNYFVEGRAFEWVMGVAMLLAGFEIVFGGSKASFGIYPWILIFVSQYYIGIYMIIVGWIRCSGLMLNGQALFNKPAGPYIRAVCAILSATLWIQFAAALVSMSIEQDRLSAGIPFWFMFTFGELYTAYITVKHAR